MQHSNFSTSSVHFGDSTFLAHFIHHYFINIYFPIELPLSIQVIAFFGSVLDIPVFILKQIIFTPWIKTTCNQMDWIEENYKKPCITISLFYSHTEISTFEDPLFMCRVFEMSKSICGNINVLSNRDNYRNIINLRESR